MMNKMRILAVVRLPQAAPLVMVTCLLGAPLAAHGQTADEIVAGNIRASGGEQALARIDNFTSKGRVTVESPLVGKLDGTLVAVHMPVAAVLGLISPLLGRVTRTVSRAFVD